jgi:hypothetical protein
MSFAFGFDAQRKIFLLQVEGVLDEPLMLECRRKSKAMAAALGAEMFISDLSAVTELRFSTEFIHQLAQEEPSIDPQWPTFIQVHNQLAYGLARMFQLKSAERYPKITVVLPHDREFAAAHAHSHFLRVSEPSPGRFVIEPSADRLLFPNPKAERILGKAEVKDRPQWNQKNYPATHDDLHAKQLLAKIARRRPTAYIPKVGDTVLVSGMPGTHRVLSVDEPEQKVDVQALSGPVLFSRALPWSLLSRSLPSRSGENRKAKKAAE